MKDSGELVVTVSPSNKVIVDSKGEVLSFNITVSNPDVNLRFVSSVNWISRQSDTETSWKVDENTSELSRKGYIYILEESTLERLDSIEVVQKSIYDEVQEDSFAEEEVPVFVPFAGNSYITAPVVSDFIDLYSGKFKGAWTDKELVTSSYFWVGTAGDLNLGVVASNNSGSSVVRFTVMGRSYDVRIAGPTAKIYTIGVLKVEKPGYIRVDMQGISYTGKDFGVVDGYRIGNQAATGELHFVTEEKMAEDKLNCYFFRRGASVHWGYIQPEGDVEYFYNEVLVTPENAAKASYFMMNGFAQGYMGIQISGSGEPKILFSVWSPYNTDNPEDIPEDQRVKLLRKGANVTVGEFGHEGSGGQSWLNYKWTPGETYKALVQVRPGENEGTIYTAYFYAENEWKLIASFWRPKTTTWYKGAHSFLENFDPAYSIYNRSVLFKNQWVRMSSGEWKEITRAKFTCDGTGKDKMRYDYSGSVDEENKGFVLTSFGFTDAHTEYGTEFTRPATGKAPDIDIEQLEKIPSVD